jgi:hypothetical protein
MNLIRASIAVASILALCRANPAPSIHYAPAENLEHVDVALIDTAKHEIDMAAYVLTDWPAHVDRRAKEAGSFFVVSCRGAYGDGS